MLQRLIHPLLALRGQKADAGERARKPAKAGAARGDVPVHGETNPYVEARREWNERYGDYIQQAHHWRTMAIICGLVALICVFGMAYIGAQNKIVPYVVEVDKLGEAAAVARADRPAAVDISNVMLVCPTCKLPTRVGYRFKEVKGETVKIRVCKREGCGQDIDR